MLAEKLDEGLQVLTGLWSGEPFTLHNRQYQVEDITNLPPRPSAVAGSVSPLAQVCQAAGELRRHRVETGGVACLADGSRLRLARRC
jgi:alkanesulfonate monooxygenase SsuD/methylene tetrahydromethanopterin reductase-like flavin-dependent oxidoreductase (luciferase family)